MLNAAEIDTFAKACLALPPGRLESYVKQFELIADFDDLVKRHSIAQADPHAAVIRAIIEAVNRLDQADIMAEQLFHEMRWNEEFKEKVGPLTRAARTGNHQALHARIDHFMSNAALEELVNETMPRICCIVGEYDLGPKHVATSGTGFLVGPDRILTAMHVVDGLVLANRAEEVPSCFRAVFDHAHGEPIQFLADIEKNKSCRPVAFHRDWLLASSERSDPDGEDDAPEDARNARYRSHLDFALIRLAETVGAEPVRGGGGIRGWVTCPSPPAAAYRLESRVVIPQHPFGSPRVTDFGRIRKVCASGTRVISEIESSKGTSGAPCLANDGMLIAIHNAEYRPHKFPEANQAIRFDVIQPRIAKALVHTPSPPPDAPWDAGDGKDNMKPIIGRKTFLDWIIGAKSAAVPAAPERNLRVYAATGQKKGAGKTFSIEILDAVLGSRAADLRVVFGAAYRLPDHIELFVGALMQSFGIPPERAAEMPPRPSPDLPDGAPDGDKIARWASQKLPEWLRELLDQTRVEKVDKRAAARTAVEANRLLERESDAELVALAEAPDEQWEMRERWQRAWIVLDELNVREIPREIQTFMAALVGVDTDEGLVPETARRLRWLFLGKVPPFLQMADATVEALDPDVVEPPAIARVIRRALAGRVEEVPTDPDAEAAKVGETVAKLQPLLQMQGSDNTLLSLTQFVVAQRLRGLMAKAP